VDSPTEPGGNELSNPGKTLRRDEAESPRLTAARSLARTRCRHRSRAASHAVRRRSPLCRTTTARWSSWPLVAQTSWRARVRSNHPTSFRRRVV
jgi:hypothetical protein